MTKLLIGIDFSYNSCGITFMYGNSVNHMCIYNKALLHEKEEVNDEKIYEESELLRSIRDKQCVIIFNYREKTPQVKDVGLCVWERIHMAQTIMYRKLVYNSISEFISTNYDDVSVENIHVAFEHYSFSRDTNVSQQMAEFTSPVKQSIIDDILGLVNLENFYVVSPSTVKKLAGGGGYDKYNMFEAFLNETMCNDFQKALHKNRQLYYKNKVKKGKPFSEMVAPIPDIIDSYYVCKWLSKQVKN